MSGRQNLALRENEVLSGREPISHSGRILFILPQPFFSDRGSPLRARTTISALINLGYEVDLLALPMGEQIALKGLRIIRGPKIPGVSHVGIGPSWTKCLFDILLFFKALILTFNNNYIAIHGVEDGGIIGACIAKLRRLPYIFDMHSWMSEQIRDAGFIRSRAILKFIEKLEHLIIRNSHGVITVGNEITQFAESIAPSVPSASLEDVPIAFDSNVNPDAARELSKTLELENRTIFLYTGNFVSYQGIDLLLHGFSEFIGTLTRQTKDLSISDTANKAPILVIVGGGGPEHVDYVKYFSLARKLQIMPFVRFLGQRRTEDMPLFFSLATVLVSPRVDGRNPPLKIYSYMAAEKLIVATRMASHTQILSDSEAILTDLTPQGLAAGLKEAISSNPVAVEQNRQRIRSAKHLVSSRYSSQEFTRRLGDLYGRALYR